MDFNVMDISSSFFGTVQQSHPAGNMSEKCGIASQSQKFADKLSQTLEAAGYIDTTASTQTHPTETIEAPGEAINSLLEKLSRKKGSDFISGLKNIFLALSNGALKNISMDADGLDALKKLLQKAGFAGDELDDVITELSEESESGELTLDSIFDRLFALQPGRSSEDEEGLENLLETSAIPFIESILNSLGIPAEKIQEILSEADRGDKGISLDIILEKLKTLQKTSSYSQNHFQTQEGDDTFQQLFRQLGLEKPGTATSSLTLDDFISSLETLQKEMTHKQALAGLPDEAGQAAAGNEKSLDLFNALFKGLVLKNKETDTGTSGFSYEQIKNQFETDLLVPKEGKSNENSFFTADMESGSAVEKLQKEALKVLKTLSGEKSGSAEKDQPEVDKVFLRQMKSGTAKLSEQSQISTSDIKTNETVSNADISKTKPSFKGLPNHVTQQVAKSIVRAVNQGENTLRIQLKPAELGRLVMTIENTGDSMKVNVMTDNAAAKDILASNVTELKTLLSNSGVTLEKFEVDMNSDFRQSMADARNPEENSGQQKRNRGNRLFAPVNGGSVSDSAADFVDDTNQSGSLHFVA